jgi:hypothetical protein
MTRTLVFAGTLLVITLAWMTLSGCSPSNELKTSEAINARNKCPVLSPVKIYVTRQTGYGLTYCCQQINALAGQYCIPMDLGRTSDVIDVLIFGTASVEVSKGE